MINWSAIVGSLTVNRFHTIGGKSFAYKNNVRLNAGPAINVVGNPASFFSGTTNFNSNINDGRTRNAARMFIYNALRAESDYTDAQAAAYGNTSSTDEFLIYRTTPGALVGSAPWPVHSTIVSGSRTAAIATSRFALEIVAIRDRSGHVRAWKRRTGLTATTAAAFATAYDKMSNAEIRAEFGLAAPAAVAGTLSIAAKSITLDANASGTVNLEAASGGTGTVTYALTSNGGTSCTLSGRTLTIPAGQAAGTFNLGVTATWTSGSSTATTATTFNLTITRRSAAPTAVAGTFSVPLTRVTIPTGFVGVVSFPAATGGVGTISYAITSISGASATVDGNSLIIPSTQGGTFANVTITATWTSGSTTATRAASFILLITRSTELAGPVAGTLSIANKSVTLDDNTAGTVTLEAASGGTGTVSYELTNNGGTSCTLSGSTLSIPATQAAGTFNMVVTATWLRNNAIITTTSSFSLTITRRGALPTAVAGTFNNQTQNVSATWNQVLSRRFTAATGGTGTITYQLRRPHPTGVTLTGTSISLPASLSGTQAITIRAIWTSGSTTAHLDRVITFNITRSARPASTGSFTLSNVTFGTQNHDAIVRRTFAAATGGFGSISYALVGSPSGVTLSGRQLTFAASVTLVSVTIRATWTSGSTTAHLDRTATFTIPRRAAPGLAYPNQTFSVDRDGTHTLPAATGGTSPYEYDLGVGTGVATPATTWGTTTNVATVSVSSFSQASRGSTMLYDRVTEQLYALIQTAQHTVVLYKVNQATGAFTDGITLTGIIGATGAFNSYFDADFTPDGRMFLVHGHSGLGGGDLYSVNTTSGIATRVGSRVNTIQSPSLFAAISNSVGIFDPGFGETLYQINLATGVVTNSSTYSRRIFGGDDTVRFYNNALRDENVTTGLGSLGFAFVGNTIFSMTRVSATSIQVRRTPPTDGREAFTTALPTGITFNRTTRVISVDVNTPVGLKSLNLRVRDSASPKNVLYPQVNMTVTVGGEVPAAVAGTFSVANKTLALSSTGSGTVTLEAASGGTGTVSYALVSPPTGITISGNTLSVASSVTAGVKNLRVRATWTSGSTVASLDSTFTLTVTRTRAPVAGTFAPTAKSASTTSSGQATVNVGGATGGVGTITYAVTDTGGMTSYSISESTGILTLLAGQAAGTFRVGIRARWTTVEGSRNVVAYLNITLTRSIAPLAGTLSISSKTLNLTSSGTGSVQIEAATGGRGTVTYALVSPPSGITILGRTVSVGSAVTPGTKSLTVRATWTTVEGARTADASFNLVVNRTQAPAAGTFSVSNKSISLNTNVAGSIDFEAATGGTGTVSYTLAVNGGTNVTLDGTKINIPANQPAGTFRLAITATWTTVEGSRTVTSFFNLGITRVVVLPPAATGTFSFPNRTLTTSSSTQTRSFTFTAASGGTGTISYSLRTPPTGVTLSGRTISIAPPNTGAVTITVRATWTSGSSTAHLDRTATINVPRTQAPLTGSFNINNQTLRLGTSDAGTYTFGAASGGTGTITYALLVPPSGVTLSGRTITVAGTVPEQVLSLTVRATWTTVEGTAFLDASFTITVDRPEPAAAVGTFALSNRTLGTVRSTASAAFVFAAAAGGTGTITYSLVNPPDGITLESATRRVTIDPPNEGAISLTIRATWTSGNSSATLDQTIIVNLPRTRPPVTGQYTVPDQVMQLVINGAGSQLLPAATGGVGDIEYDLVAPPEGITLLVRTLNVTGVVEAGTQRIGVRATWRTVEGIARLDTTFNLTITRSETQPEPATGDQIPEGSTFKCIPDPSIRKGEDANYYKVFINGRRVGTADDKRR